jgi:ABC-type glycerol-3-phosphate transport system substrate-binding protein
MKKILMAMIALMLVLAMAACGGSAPSSGDAPAEESKGSGYSGFGNSFIAESDGAGYETARTAVSLRRTRLDL